LVVAHDEDDQLDVKAVFEAFKRGIKEQVRDDDVATHFDLGVAYQDMGMFADAAAEFALVLRVDPSYADASARFVAVQAMMANPKPGTPPGEA
jgi:predicted TPR repeat methyltransferase